MPIVDTLTRSQFINRIIQIRPDNFSREALGLIFDYLDSDDNTVEFDPIGVCVEFAEMSEEEIMQAYPDIYIEDDAEDVEGYIVDFLESETSFVGKTDSGFVFVQF